MADGAPKSNIKHQQRAGSSTNAQNKKNPSKFYSRFLFKALIIAIFLVTIPFFPSESPDFSTPSIYTRGWELLQLILVGIAVSYGLFSRRNDDPLERENNNSKLDNAQSYMSKLLQFPSIFDDESDTPSGSDDNSSEKVQTWSSRYHRNEPLLVVAKKNCISVEKSAVDEKPLLLPVRSLKSRVSDGNDGELDHKGVDSRVYARSNSMPVAKGMPNGSKRMNRIEGGFVPGENSEGSRVYARSNSSPGKKGFANDSRRMSKNRSMKPRPLVTNGLGGVTEDSAVSGSLSRSSSSLNSSGISSNSRKTSSGRSHAFDDEVVDQREEKVEESVVLPSPIPWRSRSGKIKMKGESNGSSLFSRLPSMEEIESRSFKSQSPRSSQSSSSSSPSPTKLSPSPSLSSPKKLSPSVSLVSESQAKSVEDVGRKKVVYSSRFPPPLTPPPPPPPPPPRPNTRSRLVKSSSTMDCRETSTHFDDSTRRVWSAPDVMDREDREEFFNRADEMSESKGRNGSESLSLSKSVRTVRAEITGSSHMREAEEQERKSTSYNPLSKASFSEFPKKTRDLLEEFLVETDYDSESEDNENYGESNLRIEDEKIKEDPSNTVISDDGPEGPDVDKKADEFIAKFREQIRLQRIESIKKSTRQLKRSSDS